MRHLLTAWADAMTAALERFAAEAREAAKSLEERRYWQGYRDGVTDAQEETR